VPTFPRLATGIGRANDDYFRTVVIQKEMPKMPCLLPLLSPDLLPRNWPLLNLASTDYQHLSTPNYPIYVPNDLAGLHRTKFAQATFCDNNPHVAEPAFFRLVCTWLRNNLTRL
jgi:hypothetical protein